MKNCPNCGRNYSNQTSFCPKCGSQLNVVHRRIKGVFPGILLSLFLNLFGLMIVFGMGDRKCRISAVITYILATIVAVSMFLAYVEDILLALGL